MSALNLTGRITNDGKLAVYSQNELNHYLKQNSGKRVMIRFEILDERPTQAMLGYYHAKVLPDMKDAFWKLGNRKRLSEVEQFCREVSPICWSDEMDENGKWKYRLKDLSELNAPELYQHLEFIKQYAAENLHVFIHDPKIITNG